MRTRRRPSKKAKSGYVWEVIIPYTDVYGNEQTHTKSGFRTKKDAELYGTQTKYRLQNGRVLGDAKRTVAQVWIEWRELKGDTVSRNTFVLYERCFRRYVEPRLGNTLIRELSYVKLQTFFKELDHLSRSYHENIRSFLNSLIKFSKAAGYIDHDPLAGVVLGGVPRRQNDEYLSREDLEKLIGWIRERPRVKPLKIEAQVIFLKIGYFMGLRRGEIQGLMFSDIDWDARTLHVQRQLLHPTKAGEQPCLTETLKTSTSNAVLPICDELFEDLKRYRELNPFELLICDLNGRPYVDCAGSIVYLAKKKGFHFYAHQLRHSFCTNLYRAGVDQLTASRLSRHKSIHVLANIYTHAQPDDLRKAIEKAYPGRDQFGTNLGRK